MEEDFVFSVEPRKAVLLAILDVVGRDFGRCQPTLLCIAAGVLMVGSFDASLCVVMMALILVADVTLVKGSAFRV